MNDQKESPSGFVWMRWTFFEALARSVSGVFQKVVGNMSFVEGNMPLSTALSAYGSGVIGIVQVFLGIYQSRRRDLQILTTKRNIIGSLAFGVLAYVSSVFSFMVFVLGGDLGARTFIITLAIIPGAIVDRLFFGEKLSILQIVGMALGVYAGYVVLDSPSITGSDSGVPLWVWLTIASAVIVGINQGVTRWVKDVDGYVKNFWGGMVAIVLGLVTILWIGEGVDVATYERVWSLTGVSAVIGLTVVVIWLMNLKAYKEGSSVALKVLFMNGAFLALSMVAGVVIFGESFTFGKVIGVILYLFAFALIHKQTWQFVRSHV